MDNNKATHVLRDILSMIALIALVLFIIGAFSSDVMAKSSSSSDLGDGTFYNPNVYSDVPDIDMIRVGENYYMVSTTMHMSPGCPILKSTDLVNWETVNYVFDRLDDSDATNLKNGRSMYGQGQWATSIKYHNDMYYIAFNSNTTGTAYIYSTDDIENGSWDRVKLGSSFHDCGLFWDDEGDGACYLVYGNNTISYVELNDDLSGVKNGGRRGTLFTGNTGENGSNIFSSTGGLGNEGSHVYYKDGYYYVFTINAHPGKRTEVVHRSSVFPGSNNDWKTRIVLMTRFDNFGLNNLSNGVAQGGIIDTVDGDWYCYLFQDHDGVGRVPVLTELTWTNDGWPAAGVNGDTQTVSSIMDIPGVPTGKKTLVKSDEFYNDARERHFETDPAVKTSESEYNGSNLDLAWEWNHNPDNTSWSLTERDGYLRLYTVGTAKGWLSARNTLTQRTFGPTSSYSISLDVSNMKPGDIAGLGGLANRYGYIGVRCNDDGSKDIIMVNGSNNSGAFNADAAVAGTASCDEDVVHLKADFLFAEPTKEYDQMDFYYSYDGKSWTKLGTSAKTAYDISPMFMGVRIAIFNYAKTAGDGYVDVDYFHVTNELTGEAEYTGDAAAELESVTPVAGIKEGTGTVSLYLDGFASSDYSKIKTSIVIPEGLSVKKVDFNNAAIKNGESKFTFENGRLVLLTTGQDVSFNASDRLYATITLGSDTDVTADTTATLKTDFIQVDDGYIDYGVNDCAPTITIKYLTAEEKAAYLAKIAAENQSNTPGKQGTTPVNTNNSTPAPQTQTTVDLSSYVGKTFTAGGVKYKITKCSESAKTVAVTGASSKKIKKLTIKASVSYEGMKFNVTSIAKKAFSGYKNLKTITIKSTKLTSIGKNAFKGIAKKATFKVPKSKKKAYKKLIMKSGNKIAKVK